MDDNNEKIEIDEFLGEETEGEFDENGFDPTKEAFFSDLMEVEEEIASEGYELVEHAISLIKSRYFEDAVEVLRQAIGVYSQIDRKAEIEAINQKITEVYVLKEQEFRESKDQSDKRSDILGEQEIVEFKEVEKDLAGSAKDLIEQANKLIEIEEFDEAISKFDEAVKINEELKNNSEIEKIFKLIEECYNKKAIFLRKARKEGEIELIDKETEDEELLSKKEAREQSIKDFEAVKKHQRDLSDKAYELMGKGTDLAKNKDYDRAIESYKEASEIFKELKWDYEGQKVLDTIELFKKEQEEFMALRAKLKIMEQSKPSPDLHESELLEDDLEKSLALEAEAIEKKRQEIQKQKEDDAKFEKSISSLVDKAEKIARDYESAMRIAVREGTIVEKCPYPEVIDIYTEIREKLVERGWRKHLEPYNNQIKIYHEKLDKDKNLREVEEQKAIRHKAIEDMHKIKEEEPQVSDIAKTIEIDKQKEEDANFENLISSLADKAENLARGYESAIKIAIREGNVLPECPYPEVIDIYTEIREKLRAKGLSKNVGPYNNQINMYHEKIEKDKKLRIVEMQKAMRQKDIDDMHRIKEEEPQVSKTAKIKDLEEQKEKERNIDQQINEMIENIQKMDREYTSSIKKGKFINCPYPEIIEIYESVIKTLIDNGRLQEATAYKNSIRLYNEKLAKDKKLREIEAQKAEKASEFVKPQETMQKRDDLKRQKMQEIEKKRKEEENLLNVAMTLIDDAEKFVKKYELALKQDILNQISPYDSAISAYKEARKIFQNIGWGDEATRLIETIKFYKDKKVKDEKLRILELKKRQEPEIKPVIVEEVKPRREDLEKEKQALEMQQEQREQDKITDEAFKMISDAEQLAKNYEQNIMNGILNFKCPYEEIIEIYREAKIKLEGIGWNEEARKLLNSVAFYKEKLEKDQKLRALETKKLEKQEVEQQKQKSFEKEMHEQETERLKQKREALALEKEHKKSFESLRDKAFLFMDRAKRELVQENFDEAMQLYGESERIFKEIDWKEGINMVKESIVVISKKQEKVLEKRKNEEEEKAKQLEIENQLEEKLIKIQETSAQEKEQKRKELIEGQERKKQEKELSEEAYIFLEQGTRLLDKKKFEEASEKYIKARDLFEKIEWSREVSQINNELLLKVKREEGIHNKLLSLRKQKAEERKEFEGLFKESEMRPKETKKKEKFEEIDKKIIKDLDNASLLIDELKYNEAIFYLRKLIKVLEQVGRNEEVEKINSQISSLISESKVPIITLRDLGKDENLEQFTSAYRALDKAITSMSNNRIMKAISELNEASFNLKETKIGEKFIREIDSKIDTYRSKLGGKARATAPVETRLEKEALSDDEEEKLKARIAARRAERAKRVADLLKSKRSE